MAKGGDGDGMGSISQSHVPIDAEGAICVRSPRFELTRESLNRTAVVCHPLRGGEEEAAAGASERRRKRRHEDVYMPWPTFAGGDRPTSTNAMALPPSPVNEPVRAAIGTTPCSRPSAAISAWSSTGRASSVPVPGCAPRDRDGPLVARSGFRAGGRGAGLLDFVPFLFYNFFEAKTRPQPATIRQGPDFVIRDRPGATLRGPSPPPSGA